MLPCCIDLCGTWIRTGHISPDRSLVPPWRNILGCWKKRLHVWRYRLSQTLKLCCFIFLVIFFSFLPYFYNSTSSRCCGNCTFDVIATAPCLCKRSVPVRHVMSNFLPLSEMLGELTKFSLVDTFLCLWAYFLSKVIPEFIWDSVQLWPKHCNHVGLSGTVHWTEPHLHLQSAQCIDHTHVAKLKMIPTFSDVAKSISFFGFLCYKKLICERIVSGPAAPALCANAGAV